MRVTVELSESELREVQRYAKEKRKGPAIRKLALLGLRLQKRQALGEKVMRGDWAVELPDLKKLREDRTL